MQNQLGILLLFFSIIGFGYLKKISKFDVIWKYIVVIFYFVEWMAILLMFLEFIAYSIDVLFGFLILFLFMMVLAEYLFKQEVSSVIS